MTTLSAANQQEREAAIDAGHAGRRRSVMQITWSLVAGGAETYALTLASGLDRERYRAVMCGIDQGGALEPEVARRGISYHIMNRRAGIDWRLMGRMLHLFRRERIDVIHTHHFNQLFYSLPAALLLGIRVIHTEHSVEAYKKRHLRWALRAMSMFCHRVTAIGADGEATLLRKVGIPRKRLEVIRAAVDLERFRVDRDQARAALGLKASDRVLTIVARLFPEKNHALLLRAFGQVARQSPDYRLLIVGDGVEEAAIRAMVQREGLDASVRLLGVRRDIPLILGASDAFVLCSDREGLPISVLEAMAAALPVVATSVGDLPLVVKDGRTGLLVPARDAAALAAAIERVLGEVDDAQRMGQAGRVAVEAEYSLRRMVARHEQLYGGAQS